MDKDGGRPEPSGVLMLALLVIITNK
jgi:hypothetical protein